MNFKNMKYFEKNVVHSALSIFTALDLTKGLLDDQFREHRIKKCIRLIRKNNLSQFTRNGFLNVAAVAMHFIVHQKLLMYTYTTSTEN